MKSKSLKKVSLSDANLLLTITIVVFFLMYIGAMIFEGGGFLKPQTFPEALIFQSAVSLHL